VSWIGQAARILAPVERRIKDTRAQAAVHHHDETCVRWDGQLAWAHVTSTSRLTHDALYPTRGREGLEAIGILPAYGGVSVYDGWNSDGLYTACRHALCNVYPLRELTFLEEAYHHVWAAEM
jgi:hypothetical protein